MNGFDLLEAVQPSEGWYCVIGINAQGSAVQRLVSTREEVTQVADKFTAKERNVYFAVAKYKTDNNRTKENVLALKSFWVDVDCGPGKSALDEKTGRPKGYETQAEGLTALLTFIKNNKLPTPIFVDSGRGVHAYWPLTEAVPPSKWEPVAAKMRKLCNLQDFYVDGSVFEIARVMRLPGTLNFRCDPPKLATVIKAAEPTPFDKLAEILEVTEEDLKPPPPKRELTALGKALQQNVESSFATIINRCSKGDGCLQLLNCYMERATLSEPRWFDALSVAKFCSDRDTAIHKISEGHPGYEPGAVERKIVGIKGPHTCAEFEKNNPDGCKGCPHFGKITSPIVLGKIIARSAPEPPKEAAGGEDEEEEQPPLIKFSPPPPFFRGKSGGIYIEIDSDNGPIQELVYENDLYIVKLMQDPLQGFVAVFRVHLPMDGVKEFVIPNIKISEQAELRKELARNGVVTNAERFKLISAYVIASIRELQHKHKAELMRLQFGWAEKDSVFVVGDREYSQHGVHHSPPSSATNSMVAYFEPAGTLELWKQVFSLYGRPGLEIQAFAALSAFGSPLLKFTGQKGAVINLIHGKSGTGKTTVLRMANSVFGNPEGLLGTPDDTKVGRTIKAGLLNNIVNTVDEITNIPPEDASQLLYAFSQGRGKDKAKANANELRENNITWRLITLFSSNASLADKLTSIKATPDGEMLRMLEFKIEYTSTEVISTSEGKYLFDHVLNNNYGHAGPIFIKWVLENLEEVKQALVDVQTKLDVELGLTQRERNWSAVVAANITGGIIARRLKLIDFNMQNIYAKIADRLRIMVEDSQTTYTLTSGDILGVIGEFVDMNINNMLVVDSEADSRTKKLKAPLLTPRGPLYIRYEPDTKELAIACKPFRDACVKAQINYKEMINGLEERGILKGVTTKRMTKGLPVTTPGVRAIILDGSKVNLVDLGSVIETESEDGSGENKLPD